MNRLKQISLTLIAFVFLGLASANAGVSFSMGTGDFYMSVGDYDYLPYSYNAYSGYRPPRISFHDVMGEYGSWVSVSQFGQAWRPYASSGWRPYTQGHWIYTQYGPTWSGYEPWAWAAYHYGNWIFTSRYGWVWIPGYDWHPGRVSWARGYDTIGWSPMPPSGYDYSRGDLSYVGNDNQFSYYDDDFDYDDYNNNGYSYGGPYYDPRYRDNYYNSSYQNISINLWVFVGNNYFGYDNYADYYLPPDYSRYAFDRRMIRISNRPVDRRLLERIVKQRIQEVPVEVREIETDKRRVKMIVPIGQEEKIRKNANMTVRNVIAPGFAEKQKVFKGEKSKNKVVIDRIFKQENVRPKVETVSSDVLIEKARVAKKDRDEKRSVVLQREKQKVEKVEKEGKIRAPKKVQETEQNQDSGRGNRDAQFEKDKNKKQKNDVQETPGNLDKNKKDEEAVSNSGKDRNSQFENDKNKKQKNDVQETPGNRDKNRNDQDVSDRAKDRDNQFETEKKKKKDTEDTQRNQHGNSRDSQSENDDKAKSNRSTGPSNSSDDSQLNQRNKKETDAAPSGESENQENARSKKDQSDEETVIEEDNGKAKDADQEDTKSKNSKSKNKGKNSKSKNNQTKPSNEENPPDRR